MTTDEDRARPPRNGASTAMLRSGFTAALVVSAACVGVATWLEGVAGFWGSLIGAVIVSAFFATSILVLGAMQTVEPLLPLLVALGLYTVKVVALAVVFVVLGSQGWLDDPLHRGALGLTIIVSTLTWTLVQILAVVRHRQPLYDLPRGS